MQTKLTLRLERDLIEAAKQYAEARGTSVSKLVSDYFDALTRTAGAAPADEDWKASLSPAVRRLVGLARPAAGQAATDADDYDRYREEKHSRHLREADA
ncbi:MAG: DUF6364 family protein [Rhodothermales bacterium]